MVDAPGQKWGVRELGRAVGLPATTVHRVLSALTIEGLVHLDPDSGRYELGAEFVRLALKSTANMTIRQLSLPYLNRLVQDCNETAFLSVYDTQKHAAMFVAAVESPHALRYVVQLHEWMPVHVGASGLAILAFLPDAEQREVLTKELGELSASTYRRWKEKLAHVRTIGFAETTGQRVPGAVGIAAPIFAPNQRVVGDVGLSIPEQRFSASRGSQLAQMVVNTAERISRQLSGMLASMGDGTNGSIWSRALSTQ